LTALAINMEAIIRASHEYNYAESWVRFCADKHFAVNVQAYAGHHTLTDGLMLSSQRNPDVHAAITIHAERRLNAAKKALLDLGVEAPLDGGCINLGWGAPRPEQMTREMETDAKNVPTE
jgi:hypothetical protein